MASRFLQRQGTDVGQHQPGVQEVEAVDVADPLLPVDQVDPELMGERAARIVRDRLW